MKCRYKEVISITISKMFIEDAHWENTSSLYEKY